MGISGSPSVPTPLTGDHETDAFDCGVPELDSWLRGRAYRAQRNDTSRVFVTCRGQEVRGYYALAAGSVVRVEAPKPIARNTPETIPVFLLGRLAVDQREQGSGLGGFLLRDALLRCLAASESIGARAVMVDAISDVAAAFYTRYEFRPAPFNPRTLFLPMSVIRREFEAATR